MSLTSASKMPGMAIHGRLRGPEPPGGPEKGVEGRRHHPALAAEPLAQELAQVRRDREGGQIPGVDGLDLPQHRPQVDEPALVALAEVRQGPERQAPGQGRVVQ